MICPGDEEGDDDSGDKQAQGTSKIGYLQSVSLSSAIMLGNALLGTLERYSNCIGTCKGSDARQNTPTSIKSIKAPNPEETAIRIAVQKMCPSM